MDKEEQLNIEILSKIVIGLKTSQLETTKILTDEIENIKTENAKNFMSLREKYDGDIMTLNEQLMEAKLKTLNMEKNYLNEINEMRMKFEKNNYE